MATINNNEITAFLKGFLNAYNKMSNREGKRSEFLKNLYEETKKISGAEIGQDEFESFLRELQSETNEIIKETQSEGKEEEQQFFIDDFIEEARKNIAELEADSIPSPSNSNEIIETNQNIQEIEKVTKEFYSIPLGYDDFFAEVRAKLSEKGMSEEEATKYLDENTEQIKHLQEAYTQEWIEKMSQKAEIEMKFCEINEYDNPIVFIEYKEGDKILSQEDFISTLKDNLENMEEVEMWKEQITISTEQQGIQPSQEEIDRESKEVIENYIEPLSLELNDIEIDTAIQQQPSNSIEKTTEESTLTGFKMWLDKTRERAKTSKLTKAEFKESFITYFARNANEDDTKIILALLEKEPSKLNREHKALIQEGLKAVALSNSNQLGEDIKAYSKYKSGEFVNEDELDLCKVFSERIENSEKRLDKLVSEKIPNTITSRTLQQEKRNALAKRKEKANERGR